MIWSCKLKKGTAGSIWLFLHQQILFHYLITTVYWVVNYSFGNLTASTMNQHQKADCGT